MLRMWLHALADLHNPCRTGDCKQLSWILLTACGMKPNQHCLGLVDLNLTMNTLFEEAGQGARDPDAAALAGFA